MIKLLFKKLLFWWLFLGAIGYALSRKGASSDSYDTSLVWALVGIAVGSILAILFTIIERRRKPKG